MLDVFLAKIHGTISVANHELIYGVMLFRTFFWRQFLVLYGMFFWTLIGMLIWMLIGMIIVMLLGMLFGALIEMLISVQKSVIF